MPNGIWGIGMVNDDFRWDYDYPNGDIKIVGEKGDLIEVIGRRLTIYNVDPKTSEGIRIHHNAINSHTILPDGSIIEGHIQQNYIELAKNSLDKPTLLD